MKLNLPRGSASILTLLGVVCLLGIAFAGQLKDPTRCLQTAHNLYVCEMMYAQDYDECLPYFSARESIHDLIQPYIKSNEQVFSCPTLQKAYVFNSSISGRPLASVDIYNTLSLQDPVAHDDTFRTLVYMDGHANHGTAQYRAQEDCTSTIRKLDVAMLMYTEDYDGHLPPIIANSKLRNYLDDKYAVGSAWQFVDLEACPTTGYPYKLNTALLGQNLDVLPNPDSVWLFQDGHPHKDGQISYGMVSGRSFSVRR